MTLDIDAKRRSVTSGDYTDDPRASVNLFQFVYPGAYPGYTELYPWWSRSRDFQLRQTIHRESMWGSAIFKAITKRAALGWDVKDEQKSDIRINRAQGLYLRANLGKGWIHFLEQHLQDFLLTDNGAFVEVIRTSSARGGRIIGLAHLDSCRCTRTQDPSRPVLYRDRAGQEHILKDYQVLMFSDMPDASETYHGVGHCAAGRAYPTISKLAALEQFYHEKFTGDGALGLTLISGISDRSFEAAVKTGDENAKQRGVVYYKNKIVIPVPNKEGFEVAEIPLKSTPDNFNTKEERDNAYLIYANAIGVAVQDIQPLSGQGLGTGTQTTILDEAAEGQGLAAWNKQWEQMNNEHVLPAATTFVFTNPNDMRDQRAKAEVAKMRADERSVRIGSGEINVEEARQLALDAGDLTREMQPDRTSGGTLSDTEKPIEEGEDATMPTDDMDEDTATEATGVATKADDDLDRLIGGVWGEALAIAKEMVRQ